MNKIKFYTVHHNGRPVYTQAGGFGPLEGEMPFLTPIELKSYQSFWEVSGQTRPGMTVGGGRLWPDIMLNGSGSPLFFVSQKIIDSLKTEEIPFSRVTHMPIAEVETPRLLEKRPPKYYVLEVAPGIEVDYPASGIPVTADGRPDYSGIARRPANTLWFLRAETWNGTDLMGWPNPAGRSSSQLIVSQRVVDLAERDGWTNVKFDPIWAA